MTVPDFTSSDDKSLGSSALSRRTVVKTAAHTAWAAPVVIAASAAPAFAASGPAALSPSISGTELIFFPPAMGQVQGNRGFIATSSIVNSNSQPSTATRITLTVTMDSAGSWAAPAFESQISASAPGWVTTVPTIADPATRRTRVWIFAANGDVPGNGTKAFNVTVDAGQVGVVIRGDVTVDVSSSGPGETGGSDTARFQP